MPKDKPNWPCVTSPVMSSRCSSFSGIVHLGPQNTASSGTLCLWPLKVLKILASFCAWGTSTYCRVRNYLGGPSWGWCRWGWRQFLPFSLFFFVFLLILLGQERAHNCNLLEKWGFSRRPRLHRPRPELPELLPKYFEKCPVL